MKAEANNDPPKAAEIPEKNQQSINLSIIDLNDYLQERQYENPSEYTWSRTYDLEISKYDFYKYLNVSDEKILKKLLK